MTDNLSPAPLQSSYVPLTGAEIDAVRTDIRNGSPIGIKRAMLLCDMASSSLLYAEEIHRLRASPSETRKPADEGYPGIAHDLETMRTALQKIADDYPRATNEGAQEWARAALKNAAPQDVPSPSAPSALAGEAGPSPAAAAPVATTPNTANEAEHLRRQIGYIVTQLMIAGDKRSLPAIVEEAARATK